MISSDVQFEDISASDEYDSISPSAILISGQFSFEEMKHFIQNTISNKAKFYLLWETTYLYLKTALIPLIKVYKVKSKRNLGSQRKSA